MIDAAKGLDAGHGDGTVFVFEDAGLIGGLRAVADGFFPGFFCVEDGEGDVFDAVAVHRNFHVGGVFCGEATGEDEADVALCEEVVSRVTDACGEVGDLLDLEAEAVCVEERGLLGVADVELDVVDVDEVERVVGEGWVGGGLGGEGGHLGTPEMGTLNCKGVRHEGTEARSVRGA